MRYGATEDAVLGTSSAAWRHRRYFAEPSAVHQIATTPSLPWNPRTESPSERSLATRQDSERGLQHERFASSCSSVERVRPSHCVGCGGRRRAQAIRATVEADGSSTVGPLDDGRRRGVSSGEQPDVNVTVGDLRHRRRLRALLRRRDRHLERLAADRRGGGGAPLRGERHRLRRVPGRRRRTHRRRRTRRTTGPTASRSSSSRRSGTPAPRARSRTGTRSTRASPTRSSLSSPARAPTPGRSTTSPTRSTARRARAAPTTPRARTTTCIVQAVAGEKGGARLPRLHVLRGEQGHAQGRSRSTAARAASRRASRRPGRHVHAALARRSSST